MENVEPEMKPFDVFVTRSDETIIQVWAKNEDHALELASHVLDTDGDDEIIMWERNDDGYKMMALKGNWK
jgi:adenine specific DNA methylase Mod